jgi:hypothetical protein
MRLTLGLAVAIGQGVFPFSRVTSVVRIVFKDRPIIKVSVSAFTGLTASPIISTLA